MVKGKNKYHHIQLNEIGTDVYTCSSIEISYQHYLYIRKNFRHFFFDSGDTKRVVMANIDITHEQASALANAHARGKFKKEDTTKWG